MSTIYDPRGLLFRSLLNTNDTKKNRAVANQKKNHKSKPFVDGRACLAANNKLHIIGHICLLGGNGIVHNKVCYGHSVETPKYQKCLERKNFGLSAKRTVYVGCRLAFSRLSNLTSARIHLIKIIVGVSPFGRASDKATGF